MESFQFPPLEHIFHLTERLQDVFFSCYRVGFLFDMTFLSACHLLGIMIHGRLAQFA